jgi:Protein of unknown function (DUF3830)
MTNFLIKTEDNLSIRFQFYITDAPVTSEAFAQKLPFSEIFVHARVSGEEIWIDNAPLLDIIQENASVFPEPGEIVIGPARPIRNKIAGCIGIFYGEGRLLDAGNIFGKVIEEDLPLLKTLGEKIWLQGTQKLFFERI